MRKNVFEKFKWDLRVNWILWSDLPAADPTIRSSQNPRFQISAHIQIVTTKTSMSHCESLDNSVHGIKYSKILLPKIWRWWWCRYLYWRQRFDENNNLRSAQRKWYLGRTLTWILEPEVWFGFGVLLVNNLLPDVLRQYFVEHVVDR